MYKKCIKGLLVLGSVVLMLCCGACGIGNESEKSGKIDKMVDRKDLDDPRGKYPDAGTQTGETSPQIVKTPYETDDVVIADIIPTEMGYAVDATGKTDSTDGIQQALYDCYHAGGGTVYLPAGNYAITDTIYVPSFVTLRGDWQDPDEGTEYGTIISVWMKPSDTTEGGAFMIGGSAGIVGMTVYYPFQTMYEVLPYPCTFYLEDGGMLITLKDITVINGYRGIGTSYDIPHECLLINNFKGTFLNFGMQLHNQADVGTIDNVVLSSKYWKEAKADCMNRPLDNLVDDYVKENATGMIMSDLEWTNFGNIKIDGLAVGMKFIQGFRYKFAGSMVGLEITNCKKGFQVDDLDDRWGMVIAKSKIGEGIINSSMGLVRHADTEVSGEVTVFKPNSVEANDVDLSNYEVDYNASYTKPKSEMLIAKLETGLANDVSNTLQKALDEMGDAGGGIVYVPGGIYRLDHPVVVPAGVELRGSSAVASRELLMDCKGTLFMCYYGDDASSDAEKDSALITLSGKNAGLNGIRILYPENGPKDTNLNTTYTVRGTSSDVYVVNCYITASAYGIDFKDCDNHFLKGVYGYSYYHSYRLGGENGKIIGCLANPNMLERTQAPGLVDWMEIGTLMDAVVNPISRPNTQAFVIDGAKNQYMYDVFSYGSKNHIVNRNSEGTLAINIGSDNLNENGAQLVNKNGSMAVINSLRYNGHSYDNTNGTLALYNRITMDEPNEKIELVDKEE